MPRPTYTIEIFEDGTSHDGSESRSTPDLIDKRSDSVDDSERDYSDSGPPSPHAYDDATVTVGVPAALIQHVGHDDESFSNAEPDALLDEYEARDVLKSIEPPLYRLSSGYNNDRDFSAATAIHRDAYGDEDPFAEDHDEFDRRSSDYARDFLPGGEDDAGGLSDAVSAFPDDFELGGADGARVWSPVLDSTRYAHAHAQTPGQRFKTGRYYSSPAPERQGSTPRGKRFSPARSTGPRSSPHSRDASVQRHARAFRSPSSVIALQLASPSPDPFAAPSPRSARQKRSTTNMSTPRSARGSPSRHFAPEPPQQKKEYPLILLHCSVNAVALPYSPAMLQSVLPAWIQQNATLLREKLGPTVVERGILVPHPGEDYELLEERILESLELKCPRLGKCGHFLGDDYLAKPAAADGSDGGAVTSTDLVDPRTYADPKCDDCGRHIATGAFGTSSLLDHCHEHRKWEIRIYAANGLMRAGAWSAAWREMEMVDVEVGVWIPDDVRTELEGRAERETHERGEELDADWDDGHDDDAADGPGPGPGLGGVWRERQASRAHTACRARQATFGHDDMPSPASSGGYAGGGGARARKGELPLSTLLANFTRRKIRERPDIVILLSLLALALAYLLGGSSAAHQRLRPLDASPPAVHDAHAHALAYMVPSAPEAVASAPAPQRTVKGDVSAGLPACTFAPDEVGETMTVLPAHLARRVLDALATATAPAAATASPAAMETPTAASAASVGMPARVDTEDANRAEKSKADALELNEDGMSRVPEEQRAVHATAHDGGGNGESQGILT